MKIALLGTGLMGFPMGQKLVEGGHTVLAFNRTKSKAEPLHAHGVQVVDSAATAIKQTDVAMTMLSDIHAVREVLLASDTQAALPNKTILQMSTIAPQESIDLSHEIKVLGANYLEAPVLGSVPQVRDKKLIVLVGASAEQYVRWLEVLRCFGPEPVHVGQVGQAAAAKLALNQLIASLTAAFSLSLGFVQEHGVDVELFMKILRDSALYAPTFDKKLDNMLKRDFAAANFPAKHLTKDVKLLLSELESTPIVSVGLQGVLSLLEATLSNGEGDHDYSALFNAVYPHK